MTVNPGPFSRDRGYDPAGLGTGPIPAKPYYDPDYFELERKAVFMRSWIQVGHVVELPESGSFIRRDLEFAKASLLIVRGKDGEVRAFHNVCTHRGTQLVDEACGRRSTFSCPYHMWTFGTDGALLSAPDFDAFDLDKASCALPTVRLEICAGLMFVNFDRDAAPLREWLGELADHLDNAPVAQASGFSEYVYEIDANWKLTYDNFQENYHLRFIHTRSGAGGLSSENPFGYPVDYGFYGLHRTQTIWTPSTMPPLGPVQRVGYGASYAYAAENDLLSLPTGREYFALFPNYFMLGTPSQHFGHTVYPISANRSRGVIRHYWVGEATRASDAFGREYAMASARDIHSEDRSVILRGQRGLDSGALTHIHFQANEVLCRHLYVSIDRVVQAFLAEQSEGAAEALA